jgi:MoaA/NifB/PqqE/SkfB family radical SAM enzyme
MLKGIHILLTYTCNFECDHCFLYCGPSSEGTFTVKQIKELLNEAVKIGSVEWIYFEGGEPFLFYPLMLEGIKLAHDMGFKIGIVTNAYWAISIEDAELWLKPISKFEISDLSLSEDLFHFEDLKNNSAKLAFMAGEKLNLPVSTISIEEPTVKEKIDAEQDKGEPVIGGGVMFRGRAVENLIEGLPLRSWEELKECPHEDLKDPKRVHIDSFGNVHLCQGLSMGNMWETPLSILVKNYDGESHPICGPLIRGGPALLAKEYNTKHENKYVEECHFCYLTRLALLDKFPQYLTPKQVYGVK